VNITDRPQAVHDRVEKGTENTRPRDLELAPKLALGTSLRLANGRQDQKNRPVTRSGRLTTSSMLFSRMGRANARR
jgi:hypothetical protein